MNEDIDKWLDRIENLMDVQKDLQLEEIKVTFTRYDLVSLHVLLGALRDIKEKK